MIYFTAEKLFMELAEIVNENPNATVDVATYSLYLQISKNKDYSYHGNTPAREFIERINKDNLRMVIGLPYYMECKPHCDDCARNYNHRVDRLEDTANALHLNARYHALTHLKYYRVGDRIFTGGINLTSSDWTDVAMEVTNEEEKAELQRIFDMTWRNSVENIDDLRIKLVEPWSLHKQMDLVDDSEKLYMYECVKLSAAHNELNITELGLETLTDICMNAYAKIEVEIRPGRLADKVTEIIAEGSPIADLENMTHGALAVLIVDRI